MHLLRTVVLLLLGGLLAGCASPNVAIYPTERQPDQVQKTVRSGYTFLQSKDGGSVVTVSLRRATDAFVQTYVSVVNQGGQTVSINPEDITVGSENGGKTYSAYAPGEVPGEVERAARQSQKEFTGMNSLYITGDTAMGGTEGEAGSRGSYASESGSEVSYMSLMLEGQTLRPQQATSGLVFTPFTSKVGTFTMKIPVGETTHSFQFTVQRLD